VSPVPGQPRLTLYLTPFTTLRDTVTAITDPARTNLDASLTRLDLRRFLQVFAGSRQHFSINLLIYELLLDLVICVYGNHPLCQKPSMVTGRTCQTTLKTTIVCVELVLVVL
jgi:hypothetical protein